MVAHSSSRYNAYGVGVYFAADPRLSDYFAEGFGNHSGSQTVRQMLLCSVAVGRSCKKKRICKKDREMEEELQKPEHRKVPDPECDSVYSETETELIVENVN